MTEQNSLSDIHPEESGFTGINYLMCQYCLHLVRGEHRDGYNYGCGISKDSRGKYARLTSLGNKLIPQSDKVKIYNEETGCDKFEVSGLPAYPTIKEELIKLNPLAEKIPADPNAIETSWDFTDKQNNYPHIDTTYEAIR